MPTDTQDGAPATKKACVEAPAKLTPESLAARIKETSVHAKPQGEGAFIATHHGSFHADEAAACAMLKCLPEFADLPIVRTRNPEDINKAKIVVDVGGTYEPDKHRYDHHQRTFTENYSKDYPEIKLSSAGLVFKHFGDAVVKALCGEVGVKAHAKIVAKTYDTLIRELDALDNGVSVADAPRYRFVTHLGARVGRLNPSWQEESSPEIENSRFREAVTLASQELCATICGYCTGWLPARVIVEEALSKRKEVHPSGEIMKLPRFCPWQEHLFDLEEEEDEEAKKEPLIKYILFQDSRGGWRVQAAPKTRGSFENRLALPKAWRGLRDQELSDFCGVPGCVFVHAGGFIGGHTTEEGVFEMVSKALPLAKADAA